jgi:hypothetical protein
MLVPYVRILANNEPGVETKRRTGYGTGTNAPCHLAHEWDGLVGVLVESRATRKLSVRPLD